MSLLKINNLCTSLKDEDKKILKGLNLEIKKGEVHVIMGPNGAGKSSLANIILNNPKYKIVDGNIFFEDKDISTLSTDEIARLGIFMSHQTPEEIPGLKMSSFLKNIKQNQSDEKINLFKFSNEIADLRKKLDMKQEFINRELNVGFSGGEKKKNEILQLLLLNPRLAILDETDSGLDIDAINTVSKGINLFKNDSNAVLIITHSTSILKHIKVDYVHILVDGKIVCTGDKSLADEIAKTGYTKYI